MYDDTQVFWPIDTLSFHCGIKPCIFTNNMNKVLFDLFTSVFSAIEYSFRDASTALKHGDERVSIIGIWHQIVPY